MRKCWCYDLQHNFHNTMRYRLIQALLSAVAPDTCVACGLVCSILCDECATLLDDYDRCYRCKRFSTGSLTCSACRRVSPVKSLYTIGVLEKSLKDAVWFMKYSPSRSAAYRLGVILGAHLPYLPANEYVICPLPTTPSRIRQRGFDQANFVARGLADTSGITVRHLLRRESLYHQIGASRKERHEHMKDAFSVKNPAAIDRASILLIDDVITTGATIEAAAAVLRKNGAKSVLAATCARAM